jgi:hypothetical protein
MSIIDTDQPDVEQVLNGLKDFQRETVEYVFRRLYQDSDQISRFLIADEVGLGKTLVARGVIARAIAHLWEREKRIDIIYICSNQDIAQQNIDRLNITSQRKFQHASRATMLPVVIQQLNNNRLNFVSLTPNTSFRLSSLPGQAYERVVLYYMLREVWNVDEDSLNTILRGDVIVENWPYYLNWVKPEQIDEELHLRFLEQLERKPQLRQSFQLLHQDLSNNISPQDRQFRDKRNTFLGRMRRLLALTCLSALEPDLVILDEFQRFKYLLGDDNEFALLARELFNYPNAKVLLLSATPYKMYTLNGEEGEDHAQDFQDTIKFLLYGRQAEYEQFLAALTAYRRSFFRLGWDARERSSLVAAKTVLEKVLRKAMVRTERLAATENRNGMLKDTSTTMGRLQYQDLLSYVHLDHIAQKLAADEQIEYWKSSSYPLNAMEGYKLKRKFQEFCQSGGSEDIFDLLKRAEPYLLKWQPFQKYQHIDPGNSRLRYLLDQTVESGNWKWLWLPPALPYYQLAGPFDGAGPGAYTKALVFSAWRIVPKVIAMLVSYEAERRILAPQELDFGYSDLFQKRRGLLNFAFSNERLTGMPVLALIYPCLTLAKQIDPLIFSKKRSPDFLTSLTYILPDIRLKIDSLLSKATNSLSINYSKPADERWYWAALGILDAYFDPENVNDWLNSSSEELAWMKMLSKDADEETEDGSATWFAKHIEEFQKAVTDPRSLDLGRQPKDLVNVLASIALAGPAVCTLRSLLRVTQDKSGSLAFLAGAAQAGLGFRTLYNQPDSSLLIQSEYPDKDYWLATLHYGVDGNLQAVMDEFAHVLHESLGLIGHDISESALKLGIAIRQSLSIRAPSLQFDEILLDELTKAVRLDSHRIRCRYALRFGDEKSEDLRGVTRDTDVRVAFNSPFRPFILATTSVGQEGLDFHQYCHRVVHWNLPSNPVDLEQREGRVHRYKGHVIRRNLAQKYGLRSVQVSDDSLHDPWEQLFQLALKDREKGLNDLVPYWIYEQGEHRIQRIVPMFPLSREVGQLDRLKRSLVTYRSVIGQARQQEMLEYLTDRFTPEELKALTSECAIDLSPAKSRG